MLILFVVLGIILIIAVWTVSLYNQLVRAKNDAEEGFSTMDVFMKKRYDLVPNIVETVKGYAAQETTVLDAATSARYNAMNATTLADKQAAENELSKTLKSIFAITENYPDLKSNQNFLTLQEQLVEIEREISSSRTFYNATVKSLNILIETFPSNLFAKMFKFSKRDMFVVEDIAERNAVKVDFSK